MHHGDTQVVRVLRGVGGDFSSVESYATAVRRVNSRNALHQRRFACAVLAHQSVHLTAVEGEVDVAQRLDTGEML